MTGEPLAFASQALCHDVFCDVPQWVHAKDSHPWVLQVQLRLCTDPQTIAIAHVSAQIAPNERLGRGGQGPVCPPVQTGQLHPLAKCRSKINKRRGFVRKEIAVFPRRSVREEAKCYHFGNEPPDASLPRRLCNALAGSVLLSARRHLGFCM